MHNIYRKASVYPKQNKIKTDMIFTLNAGEKRAKELGYQEIFNLVKNPNDKYMIILH